MTTPQTKSGFVTVESARIYYETTGEGTPFVMIHAGVADRRQWNNEFEFFSKDYKVLRYDLRGYGKSEPVDSEFSHMGDLIAVLNALELQEPLIMMGCSMGGSLAMDFTLTHRSRVKALIMVGSAPSGLDLDVPALPKFAEAEKAYEGGDLDLLAELETQIWFDGRDRTPDQVNQDMRKLAYEMNHNALTFEMMNLGKRLPNTETPMFDRLSDLNIPVLVIVGTQDTPYILAAADYMLEKLPLARLVRIEDAAHLPNMEHPRQFQTIVKEFLESLTT